MPRQVLRHAQRAGFTDTFAVDLPAWRFRVAAAGYEQSEWAELDGPEHGWQVQVRQVAPGRAKLNRTQSWPNH